MKILVSELTSRDQLPHLLNSLNLTGIGVEVGTHRGIFARQILSVWQGKLLYCVDPWHNNLEYLPQAKFLLDSTGDRRLDFLEASRNLEEFGCRKSLVHETSVNGYKLLISVIGTLNLDFVYLDGDHSYEGVKTDLETWWEGIKPGGIIAGHDIICDYAKDKEDDWGRFILPAVREFVEPRDLTVNLIFQGGLITPSSYYIFKP